MLFRIIYGIHFKTVKTLKYLSNYKIKDSFVFNSNESFILSKLLITAVLRYATLHGFKKFGSTPFVSISV